MEKMKLYKVTLVGVSNSILDTLFIIAIDKNKAIIKANEFTHINYYDTIKCEFICYRDEIIPTVEPIKEFKNL